MRRVPKTFQLGAHTFRVQSVSQAEMDRVTKDTECYGYFDADQLVIYLLKPSKKLKASVVRQTFWHEFSHALLWTLGHKDWENEKVVDAMGHALAQSSTSFTY